MAEAECVVHDKTPYQLYLAINEFVAGVLNAYPLVVYKLDGRCTCSETCGCETICTVQVKGAVLETWVPKPLWKLVAKIFPKFAKHVIVHGVLDDQDIEIALSNRMGIVDNGMTYYIATMVIGAGVVVIES